MPPSGRLGRRISPRRMMLAAPPGPMTAISAVGQAMTKSAPGWREHLAIYPPAVPDDACTRIHRAARAVDAVARRRLSRSRLLFHGGISASLEETVERNRTGQCTKIPKRMKRNAGLSAEYLSMQGQVRGNGTYNRAPGVLLEQPAGRSAPYRPFLRAQRGEPDRGRGPRRVCAGPCRGRRRMSSC